MKRPKELEKTSFFSCSVEETLQAGKALGKILTEGTLLALEGDLGAGKTTFVKGLVQGYLGISPDQVTSPTFQYLHIHEGVSPIYHFDLYRLVTPEDFLELGFEDYFHLKGICCIEWPERIRPLLPPHTSVVRITHEGLEKRQISYELMK